MICVPTGAPRAKRGLRTAEILGLIRLKFNDENHMFGSFIQFSNGVNLRNSSQCCVTENISAAESKQGGEGAKPPPVKIFVNLKVKMCNLEHF